MKYKDPITGEFKPISVKVSDTLPIGSVVDFDGTTVPSGWEEVDNDSKILWTNPNPNSEFASQQITLKSNNYNELIWFYVHYASSNTIMSSTSIKGYGTIISVPNSQGALARRQITRNSDTKFTIGAVEGSTTDLSNLVPLYVVGKKTELFS